MRNISSSLVKLMSVVKEPKQQQDLLCLYPQMAESRMGLV